MFHLLLLATVLSSCMAEEAQASASATPVRVYDDHNRDENYRLRQNLARLRQDLNIRGNPHSHLDDPYRRNMGQRYSYRDEHDENPENVNQRENGRDAWRNYQERQRWSDKDRFEHLDDGRDIEGPVILRTIKAHEDGHKPDIARQNQIIADVYSPDYAQPTWIVDYRYLKTGGRDYTRGPGGQIIILPKGVHTNEHKEFKNYDELIEHLRERNLAERRKPQYFMPLGQEINDHENNRRDSGWHN